VPRQRSDTWLKRLERLTLALAAFAVVLWSREAAAYPWMIRHEYTGCAQCHVDPSGSGPLTAYGRAMGEVILRTHYGARPVDEEQEPGPGGKFLFGAVPLPEWLDLGGEFRVMSLTQKVAGDVLTNRVVYMQQDLSATIQTGHFVASGSVGYQPQGALLASLSRGVDKNWESREHWVGYRLDDESKMVVRAGRMNLPFGVRDILHTLTVRTATRTDVNDQQQHGVSFSYSGEHLRAEVMGILGNYQIRPDDYRERGYSGYAEWAPTTTLAVGGSSRVAHVGLDPRVLRPMWRHAHGLFARWATPFRPLVLLSEADYVIDSGKDVQRRQGMVSMLQADVEVLEGLHYQLTTEAWDFGGHGSGLSESVWGSLVWFFFSHADVRVDAIYQSISTPPVGHTGAEALLLQAHLYL
jgi:hypothetical protein